ncbi:unnamed protein product [Acanthoscelides obtectus]|uniref:Uncharacterized protein n=1 Tax=Acanthoscelides obtectus TaxID=200917 RepID=A0A9P0JQX3_ACAOB|nr:unnamed protein product [Acanthoscelides obtectus]CAK1625468.1 hypothetical protein AOBTE_LOCUS3178 [Acanthoscelides obtectus]
MITEPQRVHEFLADCMMEMSPVKRKTETLDCGFFGCLFRTQRESQCTGKLQWWKISSTSSTTFTWI